MISDLKIRVYSHYHNRCFDIDNIGNCLVRVNNKRLLQFRPYSNFFDAKCDKGNKFKDVTIKVHTGLFDTLMNELYTEDIVIDINNERRYRLNIDNELYGVFDVETGFFMPMNSFVTEEEFMKISDYERTSYKNEENIPF